MAIYNHADGPRIYRYFTGRGVAFPNHGAIIRLTLNERTERSWATHREGGFKYLIVPEDAGKIQLLDILFERGELDEFTLLGDPLPEVKPELEIPEFRT